MATRTTGGLLALTLAACSAAPAIDPLARDPTSPEVALARAPGGYLEHARSPLSPFCLGVLVAPDVVVTSAACAEDGALELAFGIGVPGEGATVRVIAALEHPRAREDLRHALVALVLERPVVDAGPADVLAIDELPCGVELPTYGVALRGDAGTRAIWRACGSGAEGVLLATDGYPSCHGESGAGAFAPGERDRVIGWVTGAGRLGAPHPVDDVCITSVVLATVSANADFLAEAMARTRVVGPH